MDVFTLVHGRRMHLSNLIRGLEQSTIPPQSLIIVYMNEVSQQWHSKRFSIVSLAIEGKQGNLPLAAARNLAVRTSTSEALIFLDVDCIPARTLIENFHLRLDAGKNILLQGRVRYLPPGATAGQWSDETLSGAGAMHVLHQHWQAGDLIPHCLFWSLNFACSQTTYTSIGGFNEDYMGYGGEDTDFAFRARRAAINVESVDALAFHQHHLVYCPPLNHFSSIIDNAQRFRRLWGHWPMAGWLTAFADAGYIDFTQDSLVVRRYPTPTEISACLEK
jgi:GT2 family glycosyltransferase